MSWQWLLRPRLCPGEGRALLGGRDTADTAENHSRGKCQGRQSKGGKEREIDKYQAEAGSASAEQPRAALQGPALGLPVPPQGSLRAQNAARPCPVLRNARTGASRLESPPAALRGIPPGVSSPSRAREHSSLSSRSVFPPMFSHPGLARPRLLLGRPRPAGPAPSPLCRPAQRGQRGQNPSGQAPFLSAG